MIIQEEKKRSNEKKEKHLRLLVFSIDSRRRDKNFEKNEKRKKNFQRKRKLFSVIFSFPTYDYRLRKKHQER